MQMSAASLRPLFINSCSLKEEHGSAEELVSLLILVRMASSCFPHATC